MTMTTATYERGLAYESKHSRPLAATSAAGTQRTAIERSGDDATPLIPEPVTALAGIAGIVMLIPFVVLLTGLPIVLAVRAVLDAVQWIVRAIA
jgi:hypothetical protein